VPITLQALRSNSNTLAFSVVNGPTNGSLGSIGATSCTGDSCTATVSYTPGSNYSGPDSFTFRASDGAINSNVSTVSITVTKLTATINVSGFAGIFDGNPHGATGSATGVNNEDLTSLLNFGASFTNVPGGIAHWTFAGNSAYESSSGDVSITISKAPSSTAVTFESGPYTYRGSAFTATATATGASLSQAVTPVNYSGDCTNVTSANGCTASATYSGDTNHEGSAGSASITITKANQTITFGALANKTFGDPDFPVSATATSGLAVSFAANAQCTVAGTTVHLTGNGSCTITASQAGNGNVNAAPNVQQSFTITRANQTITFGALANKTFGDPDFTVSATATSGLAVSFAASGQCTVAGTTVHLTGNGSCTITASQTGNGNFNAAPDVQQSFTIAGAATGALISLSQSNYNVVESDGAVTITVNRAGDTSVPVTVDYATNDTGAPSQCAPVSGNTLASSRCDFDLTLGTLNFAAGETQKTFVIPIIQDSYTEGPETFLVNLSNLTGTGAAFATPSSATVTISDGVTTLPPNAIDDTSVFVRMQYHDFLNREPDAAGLAFWTGEINNCTPKPQCTAIKRVNVSAAFFLSIEFQTTGNLVRSAYVAALDRPATNNMPNFIEFMRDTQAMQAGVTVGQGNWQTTLDNNRTAFLNAFVMRPEFVGLYPTTDTPTQYVDKLYLHAGVVGTNQERLDAIAEFGAATTAADQGARGRALLRITQNAAFQSREMNRAFVQVQYFGYLRRNPNDPPDGNFVGYNFWVNKMNQFNGDFVKADMVSAFITSAEYRGRFGPN
jgi:hypothetical protein